MTSVEPKGRDALSRAVPLVLLAMFVSALLSSAACLDLTPVPTRDAGGDCDAEGTCADNCADNGPCVRDAATDGAEE